jgi:hypothetical protein
MALSRPALRCVLFLSEGCFEKKKKSFFAFYVDGRIPATSCALASFRLSSLLLRYHGRGECPGMVP